MKKQFQMALRWLLVITLFLTITFVQPSYSYANNTNRTAAVETSVDDSAFTNLLKQYMHAYVLEYKPGLELQEVLAITQKQNGDYQKFLQNLSAAKLLNQYADESNVARQIHKSDSEIETGISTQAGLRLLENMFSGDINDYNHKILVLLGITIFDPVSALAVQKLFRLLGSKYFNQENFKQLRYDGYTDFEKYKAQLVEGAGSTVKWTTIGITTWLALKFSTVGNFVASLHPRNWLKSFSKMASHTRQTVKKTPRFSIFSRKSTPPNATTGPTTTKNTTVHPTTPLSADVVAKTRLTAEQMNELLAESDRIEQEALAFAQTFSKIGVSGAHDRLAKVRQQSGHSLHQQPGATPKSATAHGAGASKTAKVLSTPNNMQSLELAKARAGVARLGLKVFQTIFMRTPADWLKGIALIAGVGVGGGAANIAYENSGYELAAMHLYPPELRVHKKILRLVPEDKGGKDLLTHHFRAMQALSLSCQLHDTQKQIEQDLISVNAGQEPKNNYEFYTQNFLNSFLMYTYLDETSHFQLPVPAPAEIKFKEKNNLIILNLPIEGADEPITEYLRCDRYDGLGDEPLQISLNELRDYDFENFFNQNKTLTELTYVETEEEPLEDTEENAAAEILNEKESIETETEAKE